MKNTPAYEARYHGATNGIKYHKKISRVKTEYISTILPHSNSNPYLLGSYAALLKIHLIHKKIKPYKEIKTRLYKEFIDFLENDLQAVLAMELNLTFDLLGATSEKSEYVQGLPEFGSKNIIPIICGTSWDLFFLRFLHRSLQRSDIYAPVLVTCDDSLIKLSKYCALEGMVSKEEDILPVVSFLNEEFKDSEFEKEVDNAHKKLFFSAMMRRLSGTPYIGKEKLESIVCLLEKELIGSN